MYRECCQEIGIFSTQFFKAGEVRSLDHHQINHDVIMILTSIGQSGIIHYSLTLSVIRATLSFKTGIKKMSIGRITFLKTKPLLLYLIKSTKYISN